MMRCESRRNRSFSIVEMLAVVAIIALLIGILMPVLGNVITASKRSATLAMMQDFAAACNRFEQEHGFYPGLVPEPVLAFNNHEVAHGYDTHAISGTENALLHLQGGYALRSEMTQAEYDALLPADGWVEFSLIAPDDSRFEFKFNLSRFGEGPVINGKQYPPYFSSGGDAIRIADLDSFNQWPYAMDDELNEVRYRLPDVVDAWGTPLLHLRQCRNFGPIGGDAHIYAVEKPRFMIDVIWPYVRSKDQMWWSTASGGDARGSIISTGHHNGSGGFGPHLYYPALARIVKHPSFEPDDPQSGTVLGQVMIISAGPDGIYFSAWDGPGSRSAPIGEPGGLDYNDFLTNPGAIELFDDIRLPTGGS